MTTKQKNIKKGGEQAREGKTCVFHCWKCCSPWFEGMEIFGGMMKVERGGKKLSFMDYFYFALNFLHVRFVVGWACLAWLLSVRGMKKRGWKGVVHHITTNWLILNFWSGYFQICIFDRILLWINSAKDHEQPLNLGSKLHTASTTFNFLNSIFIIRHTSHRLFSTFQPSDSTLVRRI